MSVETPNRDLSKLNPAFRKKVEAFLAEAKEVFVTEGWRSQERQERLYASGRTRPWPIVTWTKTSMHTLWRAIDIAFNGSQLYPTDHKRWVQVAKIAKKHGLARGYDLWNVDKPHFEDISTSELYRDPLVYEAMEKGYYNGQEGDGVTDRTVILAMKIAKGESALVCEHAHEHQQDLINKYIPLPTQDKSITFEFGTPTTDIDKTRLEIIINNCALYRSDVLRPIWFKRVKAGWQVKINFAHPGDPRLPVEFKEQSIAYAIPGKNRTYEIWLNDKRNFDVGGEYGLVHKLTHERGHVLWCEHIDDPECVMYWKNVYWGGVITISEQVRKIVQQNYREYR